MKALLGNLFAQTDLGLLPSVSICILFLIMLTIVVWTYLPRNRKRYDDSARLTLDKGNFYD